MEHINAGSAIVKAEPKVDEPERTKSWRTYIAVDPLAANMPAISPEVFEELVAHVSEHGILNEVTLYRDPDGNESILDGCNRLDAAERAGLAIIKDGVLDPDVVPIRRVHGNADRKKYVLGQNFLRRHLNREQKRDAIAALLKEDPGQSDRSIGHQIGADHKTVTAERRRMERIGDIPQCSSRMGRDRRAQRAGRSRRTQATYGQHQVGDHEQLGADDDRQHGDVNHDAVAYHNGGDASGDFEPGDHGAAAVELPVASNDAASTEPEPVPSLLALWREATPAQRHDILAHILQGVELEEFLSVLSVHLRRGLEGRLLSLQGLRRSDQLTKTLKKALRSNGAADRITALDGMNRTLAADGLDFDAVHVRVPTSKK
jgi:hypothetical protein